MSAIDDSKESTPTGTSARAGYRRLLLPGFVFSGVAVFLLFLGAPQRVTGLVADDAIYLLMVDAYSPYFAELAERADFVTAHVRFPPLYPAVLAVLGASSERLLTAHTITIGFLIASLVVCYFWTRRELGFRSPALLLVLALTLQPTTQVHALDLWSEHLYLLLSVSALALPRGGDLRGWLVVAVLAGAAALTRTAGVALLAAFVATVWLTPAPRKLSLTAVFVIPFAAWMVMNALDPVDDDNVEFLMQEYDAISAHVVWRTLVDNAHALWVGWCASFDIMGSAIGRVVGAACAALWVAGLSLRLRDRQADAIYVVFYLGVIMVWPNDDHARRFLFPLVPLAFFHCLAFLSRLPEARNRMTPRLYGTGFAVVLIVTAAPSSAAITARLLAPIDPLIADFRRTTAWLTSANAEIAAKNLQLVNLAIESYRLVARHVPAGECVFSVHPELFMLHARRSSYPPPIPSVSDAEFKARIRRCRYVHLLWTATHPYLAPGYPGARLEGGTVVFKTQSTFAAGKVGAYSALVDLRGEAISRDEAHDRPVIAPRASARARRPVVAGAQPVSVGGRRPCTAASP